MTNRFQTQPMQSTIYSYFNRHCFPFSACSTLREDTRTKYSLSIRENLQINRSESTLNCKKEIPEKQMVPSIFAVIFNFSIYEYFFNILFALHLRKMVYPNVDSQLQTIENVLEMQKITSHKKIRFFHSFCNYQMV